MDAGFANGEKVRSVLTTWEPGGLDGIVQVVRALCLWRCG